MGIATHSHATPVSPNSLEGLADGKGAAPQARFSASEAVKDVPQISLTPARIPAGRTTRQAVQPASMRDGGERDAAAIPALAPAQGRTRVEQAIAEAARNTGVDFGFLLAQARVESAMDPDARATTSSARGLYQFIESTWLSVMERHGARFGLGDVAARITRSPGGEARVADPTERRAILAMRNDSKIAALMAAGLSEDNRAHLTPVLGREPDDSELYLAHFLGAGGAARFLTEMARDPGQDAAALFPRPAAANRPLFHEAGGRARSLAEVMEHLSARMARAGAQDPDRAAAQPFMSAAALPSGPGGPNTVAAARAAIRARAPLDMPTLAEPSSARPRIPPMSRILSARLDGIGPDTPALERAGQNIRAAYDKLKALGL